MGDTLRKNFPVSPWEAQRVTEMASAEKTSEAVVLHRLFSVGLNHCDTAETLVQRLRTLAFRDATELLCDHPLVAQVDIKQGTFTVSLRSGETLILRKNGEVIHG
ncbi:hypothetical protein [Azospirillum aestuarii]|uniref:hypothetical protein n=1 Tax=Azospirillum aestuarii TaxID=2802052 RepID=UPI004054D41C